MSFVNFILLMSLVYLNDNLVKPECLSVEVCTCETFIDGTNPLINCNNKSIISVPKFKESVVVYSMLSLADNKIENLYDDSFKGVLLEGIDLSNNQIKYISSKAFNGVEAHLKKLILNLHVSIAFPGPALSLLVSLVALHITGYGQSQLPAQSFLGLPQLGELKISAGKLSNLDEQNMGFLKRLTILNLDDNLFKSIPTESLKQLVSLRKLSFINNSLTEINENSLQLSASIEDLDFSYNNLRANINSLAFKRLAPSLKYFTLISCNLVDFSMNSFTILNSLTSLKLQFNNIVNIPVNFFSQLTNLLYLNMAYNQIKQFQQSLSTPSTFTPLVYLNCESNPLVIDENALNKFSRLEILILTNIQAITLTMVTFQSMKTSLKILNLSKVKVGSEIWTSLKPLKSLQELSLSSCSINSIPDESFNTNVLLRNIDLSNNQISEIGELTFKGLENSLSKLNLESNQLSTLDECSFLHLKMLDYSTLQLKNNPIKCDCNIYWMFKRIRYEKYFSTLTWQCSTGELMSSLRNETFLSCSVTGNACQNTFTTVKTDVIENLNLEITEIQEREITLEWSVNGPKVIYSFTITLQNINDASLNNTISFEVPSNTRKHVLSNLKPSNSYTFCVIMHASSDWLRSNKDCKTKTTNSSSNIELVGPIVGGVLGGLALIILVIIFICCLIKYRNKQKEPNIDNKEQYDELRNNTNNNSQRLSTSGYSQPIIVPHTNSMSKNLHDQILTFMVSTTNATTNKFSSETATSEVLKSESLSVDYKTLTYARNIKGKSNLGFVNDSNVSRSIPNNSRDSSKFVETEV